MTLPLITIGITTFDAEKTIAVAMQSALAQRYQNFEIVVVDDASRDFTVSIIRTFSLKDPRINVILHQENKGVAAARNHIIQSAQGELIAFFDDDDVSDPDRLMKQYERITHYELTYGTPVLCFSARTQVFPNKERHYASTMGMDVSRPAPAGCGVAERILTAKPLAGGGGTLASCSLMARTRFFRDMGGFDENFRRSEDTEFNVRAALTGAHFVGMAEPLVTQTMTLSSEKRLQDERFYMDLCLQKHQAIMTDEKYGRFCRTWSNLKYDYLEGHKGLFAMRLLKAGVMHPVWTAQRLLWAMPTREANNRFSKLHVQGQ